MTNFSDAATRNWRDAKHLLDEGRHENADQLLGFAAECALKVAVISHFKLPDDAEPPSGYLVHINELWGKVRLSALLKRYPSLETVLKQENPFGDWHTRQRYAKNGTVTLAAVEQHKKAAQRVLGAVQLLGIRS